MAEGHAELLLADVSKWADALAANDKLADVGYAHLGWMLLEVAEMQYWKIRYETFTKYLEAVAAVAKRTPGQIRQYFLTVRDLSSDFSSKQLEDMGITKATKVRNAKDYALVLPPTIIAAALDATVSAKDLKKVITTELRMPEEEGDWMDLGMEFVVTAEQRATIEQAIDAARHTEPLTKSTISESAQNLDVMMKFAMEYLGAHTGDGQ